VRPGDLGFELGITPRLRAGPLPAARAASWVDGAIGQPCSVSTVQIG
jgi:hypothetical protein